MTARSGSPAWDSGCTAALFRFPQSEFAIRKLWVRSEAFRDMCEELAEAERALANVRPEPPGLSAARQAEWQELVALLIAEIATALKESESWSRRQQL
jgi:hypothetical protein